MKIWLANMPHFIQMNSGDKYIGHDHNLPPPLAIERVPPREVGHQTTAYVTGLTTL